MKSLDPKFTTNLQWDIYKNLEMIPVSAPNPSRRANHFSSVLNFGWRPLLGLLIDELVEDQRVEYLDRCWSLKEFEGDDNSQPSPLHQFFVLIK